MIIDLVDKKDVKKSKKYNIVIKSDKVDHISTASKKVVHKKKCLELEDIIDIEDKTIPLINEKDITNIVDMITHHTAITKDCVCDDLFKMKMLEDAILFLNGDKKRKYDYNIFKLVIDKRSDIYKKTGCIIPIKKIVDCAINLVRSPPPLGGG